MPELSNGMNERSLADIFRSVESGELMLPELQRPSVWGSSKVPRFLSSVYKDYPFGSLLIWTPKPDDRIRCRPFAFEKSKGFDTTKSGAHYLIDGQQRVTSLFRALHKKGDLTVAFNIETEEFALPDARIRTMMKHPAEHGWYPVKELLGLGMMEQAELAQRHKALGNDHLERVLGKQGFLLRLLPERMKISFYNIHEKTYADVSEIFERINLGTPVRISQIVLGKLSTVFPGVVSEVESFLEDMRKKQGSGFHLDLFISTFAATATGFADVGNLEKNYLVYVKPNKNRVSSDIKVTQKAMQEALAYIDKYLFVDTLKYFQSDRTLTCLSYLISRHPSYLHDERNAAKVALWTAWSVLTFHHGDNRRLVRDVGIIRDCEDEFLAERLLDVLRKEDFEGSLERQYQTLLDMESPISRSYVLFGFLYALIRSKGAKSFPSGKPILTQEVDETEDEEESADKKTVNDKAIHEHHIYPDAKLKEEAEAGADWITKEWIYDLANFTFLTGADNIGLQNPPIEYLWGLTKETREQHLIVPRHYVSGQYDKFLTERRKLIADSLREFLEGLEQRAAYPVIMEAYIEHLESDEDNISTGRDDENTLSEKEFLSMLDLPDTRDLFERLIAFGKSEGTIIKAATRSLALRLPNPDEPSESVPLFRLFASGTIAFHCYSIKAIKGGMDDKICRDYVHNIARIFKNVKVLKQEPTLSRRIMREEVAQNFAAVTRIISATIRRLRIGWTGR